ncbi:MAG: hypothetical protein JWN46_1300 [Acidimicrobiales bacterium]|nr:hypothetical protein [Acidimicrobiales bacterium]
MGSGGRRFRWWLAGATALAFAVRIAWLVWRWNAPIGFEDAFFYHHQANLLASGKGFIGPLPWFFQHQAVAAAEHPPLYSLYLSVFSFFGGRSVGWHQIATTLLGTATVPLVGLAAREVRGWRVGVIAAVIAAVYPNLWYQNGIVWSETMAQATVALFVFVAYRYVRRPSSRTLASLGLVAALATMARTELVLLFPVVVLPLALLTDPLPWRRRFAWAGAAFVALLVGIAPWTAMNLGRFHDTTTLSSNFGLTMASASCDSTYYGPRIGYWSFWCAESRGTAATLAGGDQSQVDALARQQAVSYVRANAGRLPAVLTARVARVAGVWQPFQQADFDQVEGRPRPVAYAGLTTWWLVAGLAVIGTVRLRRVGVVAFPALGTAAIVALAMVVAFASTRYRASCEPALVVLAAVGVEAIATLAATQAARRAEVAQGDAGEVTPG